MLGFNVMLLLNDLFVQHDFNSFVMCYVQIFERIKMDGWMDVSVCSLQCFHLLDYKIWSTLLDQTRQGCPRATKTHC